MEFSVTTGSKAWRPKSAVEYPFPPFLDPYRHLTFGIATFFRSVVESQTVLADFDEAKTRIVTRVQTIPFGGDAIAVELSLATFGIAIEFLHDVQNGAGDNFGVVGNRLLNPSTICRTCFHESALIASVPLDIGCIPLDSERICFSRMRLWPWNGNVRWPGLVAALAL
jgi:hypothetical protein